AQLLPRYAAAARHCDRTSRRPARAHPGRARERTGPCRVPVDARSPAWLRRPGRHGPSLVSPAPRDRAPRRRRSCPCQRPYRRAVHQGRAAPVRWHRRSQSRRRGSVQGDGRGQPRARRPRGWQRPHRCHPRAGRAGRSRRRTRSHRAPSGRRSRARGHVPRAHRRHAARRSRSMTTTVLDTAAVDTAPALSHGRAASARIPLTRIVGVELRKMFDTRAGFWLMASILISSLLATAALIVFAEDEALTFENFAAAIGAPMTVILPMIGILAVTGEWSQRSGLTTFTLIP